MSYLGESRKDEEIKRMARSTRYVVLGHDEDFRFSLKEIENLDRRMSKWGECSAWVTEISITLLKIGWRSSGRVQETVWPFNPSKGRET